MSNVTGAGRHARTQTHIHTHAHKHRCPKTRTNASDHKMCVGRHRPLSLSLSFPLSLSLLPSLSLLFVICISHYVCLSLFLFVSLSVCLSLCLYIGEYPVGQTALLPLQYCYCSFCSRGSVINRPTFKEHVTRSGLECSHRHIVLSELKQGRSVWSRKYRVQIIIIRNSFSLLLSCVFQEWA